MKGIKKFLIASMCVAAMGAIVVPVTGEIFSGKATDNALTWDSIDLQTEYLLDETIVIPDRDVYVGGDAYDAVIKMTYPNGTITKIDSGEFQLSQPGCYTLIYEGTDSGKTTEKVPFLVADKLWSVSNPKSEIKFGTVGSSSGLLVKLAKNDTLRFNRLIDLSDLEATDDLIRAFINPTTPGTYEFDKLVFTLTDATDPTQTLTIRGNRSSTNNQMFASYWTSAGPNQTLGGWDRNANGGAGLFSTTATDGIRGRHAQDASFYSHVGGYNPVWHVEATADKCQFQISYDKDDVKTYINGDWIADHDNGEYYETEPLWNGFPSNKVFLSVQALDCTGEEANFCIMKVHGYDKFTEENTVDIAFKETDAPEITVDVDKKYVLEQNGTYTMIPKAVVGAKYPVPVASAYDLYTGSVAVETKVYHNYSSVTGRAERPVKNGTFLVNKTGKHAIVYKATDNMGNTTEKIYWVEAVKELENPLAISLAMGDVKTEGLCGEKIVIAPYEATGGSGDVNVKITATCGETTLSITKDSFIPEMEGEWTVEYVATDYAGCEVRDSYKVTIARGSVPIFVGDPLLPKYIISGLTYNVPTVKANDYSTGVKEECIADMILVDGENETRYSAGDQFTPTVKDGETTITLKFVAGDAEYVKAIPVISPFVISDRGQKQLYVEKMFVGENITAERTQNGLKITTEAGGDAKWTFANAVVADKASVNVKGIQKYSNFSAMKVTFTDYVDENVSVTMTVKNQANGFAYAEFGDLSREMTKGFNLGKSAATGDDLDTFAFSYSLGKFYVDRLAATVTVDDQGNAFNGFPSGRVYISVEIEDAQPSARYYVRKLDNHIMTTLATSDRTAPRVAIVGEYGGIHSINSVYSVAPALASDTMDANISAVVTVRNPNGEILRDVNGLLLENVPADKYYDIKLTQYGQYKVKYVAEDYTNTIGEIEHTINVFDAKAPTASLADTWSATAKLGDTVILPEIYVVDDSSSVKEMKVFRYVRNPYGKAITFGQDYVVTEYGQIKYYRYSFTFTNVGEYTFINVVYDGAGNQRIVEYTVTVEE